MKFSVCTPSIRPKGLEVVQESLGKQTIQDFEWLVELGIPEKGNDLNTSYNRMIQRATGEIFVSVQDYHKLPPEFLENCLKAYKDDTFFTCPVGKTLDWQSYDWDWRANTEKATWQQWEIDCGFAPMEAIREIGGFDEGLDKETWTFDNVNVGLRAHLAGYKFACLKDNKVQGYDHDKTIKHPFRDKYNPDYHNARLDAFRKGLKINYLN